MGDPAPNKRDRDDDDESDGREIKRLNAGDAGDSPPSKREHDTVSGSSHNTLLSIPRETRNSIFRGIVNPLDINGTLERVNDWSLTSHRLNKETNENIDKKILTEIGSVISFGNNLIENFKFPEDIYHGSRNELEHNLDRIPFNS